MALGRRKERWYWCQEHQRAEERREACPRDRRLGPYESREAAESWKERFEARDQAWKDADEDWANAGLPEDEQD